MDSEFHSSSSPRLMAANPSSSRANIFFFKFGKLAGFDEQVGLAGLRVFDVERLVRAPQRLPMAWG